MPAGPPLRLGVLPLRRPNSSWRRAAVWCSTRDGLVEDRERDIDEGLELFAVLADQPVTGRHLYQVVLERPAPDRPSDDIALIVAGTRALGAEHIAKWQVPSEPAAVGEVRASVTRQLAEWDLDDMAFTTELILALINAIRYGSGASGPRTA